MTTEVTVLLETLMQKSKNEVALQAENSPAKNAELNVLETSIYLATADTDVRFAVTATPTKLYRRRN